MVFEGDFETRFERGFKKFQKRVSKVVGSGIDLALPGWRQDSTGRETSRLSHDAVYGPRFFMRTGCVCCFMNKASDAL